MNKRRRFPHGPWVWSETRPLLRLACGSTTPPQFSALDQVLAEYARKSGTFYCCRCTYIFARAAVSVELRGRPNTANKETVYPKIRETKLPILAPCRSSMIPPMWYLDQHVHCGIEYTAKWHLGDPLDLKMAQPAGVIDRWAHG